VNPKEVTPIYSNVLIQEFLFRAKMLIIHSKV